MPLQKKCVYLQGATTPRLSAKQAGKISQHKKQHLQKQMKRQLFTLLVLAFTINAMGQRLISCDNDTTFNREYVDDEEWNILSLGGIF